MWVDRAARCEALAHGSILFDPDAASQCVEGLRSLHGTTCRHRTGQLIDDAGERWEPASCDRVEQPPRLPNGEPTDCAAHGCGSNWSCIAGPTCGAQCMQAREGDSCAALPCAAGLICEPDTVTCGTHCSRDDQCSSRLCIGGACVDTPFPPIGSPCLVSADGSHCAVGALCDATGTCAAQSDLGGPCTSDAACRYGQCDGHICSERLPCSPYWASEVWGCDPGHPYCGLDSRCTSDTTAIQCASRLAEQGSDTCPAPLACDTRARIDALDATCHPLAAVGASCDTSVVCEEGSTCADGRCVRLVAPGGPCGADRLCFPYERFECVAGVCTATSVPEPPTMTGDIGQPCIQGFDGPFCSQGRCVAAVCQWVPAGAPCTQASDCPGATCINPRTVCPMYRFVGDGEECDDALLLCPPPMTCESTLEWRSPGVHRRICRLACP